MYRAKPLVTLLWSLMIAVSGVGQESKSNEESEQPAPLFDRLGGYHHAIETDVPLAQTYFDQGLVLAFGFNHAEAARSFREAQKLDPNCAMAYWGEALVLGPNINAGMPDEAVPDAWAALQKALQHADQALPRHRHYIKALAKRYRPKPVDDRGPLDQAYANAMRELADQYADDYDAQALFAESLMDTTPWNYWQPDAEPKEVTREILQTLERVLARKPSHPLANHLYIHTVEAVHPEWGLACAERIGDLVPNAAHLVHMPSHIYIRVGRYADANTANERAIAADKRYISQCHAQGVYALGYVPHNHHFLWFGRAMTGERQECLASARHVADYVDPQQMRKPGMGALQHYYTLPMQTYVRFGMWEEALAEKKPAADLKYPVGIWRFARGMAFARTDKVERARAELEALAELAGDRALDKVTIWEINTSRSVLRIAEKVLAASIAEARDDFALAEYRLREAVRLEAGLSYDEPPTWFIPVRQLLGAVLLKAEKPGQAESVYRKDLDRYPQNGWSLFGLTEALRAQGKTEAAQKFKKQFEEAWQEADVTLKTSRF